MKKLNSFALLLLLFSVSWSFACSNDDDDVDDAGTEDKGPGAFSEEYETSAGFFTNMGGMFTGTSPHGQVQIWYSANVRDEIKKESFTVPEGTVSIKKFDTTGDGSIDGLVVMVKKETDYDPENNDWYYETRSADGTLLDNPTPGKIDMCINCHKNFKDQDFLAGTMLTLYDGPGEYSAEYETSANFFTNMSAMTEGASPHGKVKIWYSKNVQNLIGDADFVVPKGTVSIKKFDQDKDDNLDGIAVMIKQGADYDPDNNNWYYEMRGADGSIMNDPTPGKVTGCISCHQNWKAQDFLGGTELQ